MSCILFLTNYFSHFFTKKISGWFTFKNLIFPLTWHHIWSIPTTKKGKINLNIIPVIKIVMDRPNEQVHQYFTKLTSIFYKIDVQIFYKIYLQIFLI